MDVKTLQNRYTSGGYVKQPKKKKRSVWRAFVLPSIKIGAGVGVAAVVVALVLMAANAAVSRVSRPIKLLNSEYRETHRVSSQLASLKRDNALLVQRIKHTKSHRGAEHSGRKLGLVKPGEIILVIPE